MYDELPAPKPKKRNNQIRICGENLNENAVIYVHGKGGNEKKLIAIDNFSLHLKSLDLIHKSLNPWDAKIEFKLFAKQ